MRGRDIKRYAYEWAGLYLIAIFPARHYNIDDFPAVKQYLLSIGIEKLEQTGKTHIVNGEAIKARKKTNNKWFETQDSISYWDDFNNQKIVWASVGGIEYSLIPEEYMLLDTNYFFAILEAKELLAVLNSKLLYWWISQEDTPIGDGGAYRHYKYNLEKITIPQVSNSLKKELSNYVDEILLKKKQNENTRLLEDCIDEIVYRVYNLTKKEISVIENI